MDNLPVQPVGQVEHIPVEGAGLLPQGSQAGLGVGPLQSSVAAVEVAHHPGTGVGLGALPLLDSQAGLGALPLLDTRAGLGAHLLDSRADHTDQLPHPLQTLLPGHLTSTIYLQCSKGELLMKLLRIMKILVSIKRYLSIPSNVLCN